MKTKRMFVRCLLSIVLLPLLLAPSCDLFAVQRVIWSSDGAHALLIAESAVTVCDDQGGLLVEAPISTDEKVVHATWFPKDRERFVVITVRQAKSWGQLRPAMSEEEENRFISLAPTLREQILAHAGAFKDWKPPVTADISDEEGFSLWLYVRERHAEELKNKLGEEWPAFAALPAELFVGRIMHLQQGRIEPEATVLTSIYMPVPGSVQVSPDEQCVAWVGLKNKGNLLNDASAKPPISELYATRMQSGKRPLRVDQLVSWYPGWCGDSLVYGHCAAGKPEAAVQSQSAQLGTLRKRQLLPCDGGEPGCIKVGDPVELAGILFTHSTRAVGLPDGRILFNAASLQLPAAVDDALPFVSLFGVEPGRATIAPMVTTSAMLQMGSHTFSEFYGVNPDATRVAIGGRDEKVSMYEFATGKVRTLIQADKESKMKSVPTWRSPDEVSVIVPPGHEWGSKDRPELVLYSLKTETARCISKAWPEALVRSLLTDNDRTTQPSPPEAPSLVPASSPGA